MSFIKCTRRVADHDNPAPFFKGRIVDLSRATVDVCRVIPSDRVLAMALNGSYSQFVTCSILLFNLYS